MQLNPGWFPPKFPEAYTAYRAIVFDTRRLIDQAQASLTSTPRKDATKPYWVERAIGQVAEAAAFMRAGEHLRSVVGVKLGAGGVITALDGVRSLLVNERDAVAAGAAKDPQVYADARTQLQKLVQQLGWWEDQLPAYVPPAPAPTPPAVRHTGTNG